MKLTNYQERALERILGFSLFSLSGDTAQSVLLQAPTGAGKTVMGAAILKKIAEEIKNTAFIWISIGKGKLHEQSQASLRKNLPNFNVSLINALNFSEGMQPGSVHVVNWEKLNRDTNKFMLETENYNFKDFITLTKRNGTKIVMVVDESHIGTKKDSKIEGVKRLIGADLVLNVSATPNHEADYTHKITHDEVIEDEVIKKKFSLQNGTNLYPHKSLSEAALFGAMDKRDELAIAFKSEGTNINPLTIIQLPNDNKGGLEVRANVEHLLGTRGKTYENGKVAVKLSGEEVNWDDIANPENGVEYLLFKAAVATGWDCPRAHILVKFRDTRSTIFERQVVGRIARMPERKYYVNDMLNIAYIFHDLMEWKFEDDYHMEMAVEEVVPLKEGLSLELPTEYLPKVSNFDYSKNIAKHIYDALDKKSIDFDVSNEIMGAVLKDAMLEHEDLGKSIMHEKQAVVIKNAKYIYEQVISELRDILKNKIGGRAVNQVVKILVDWIANETGWDRHGLMLDPAPAYKVILNQLRVFSTAISDAVGEYETKVENVDLGSIIESTYSLPKTVEIYEKDTLYKFGKYAYTKCKGSFNSLELREAYELDLNPAVEYWLKNGDKGSSNFSIVAGHKNFYPDFIVKYKNGDIKIIETKGEIYHEESKREALTTYGKKHGILTEYILE